MPPDARPAPVAAYACYLPQFYPTPLNSTWWGEGFTEWVSVLRAHEGWRSPPGTTLTPGELGFYDLRSTEVRARQGELFRTSGLSALCLYHYWSAGERLLPDVEDAFLADGEPAVPFFFGWANHDWTLAWQNRPREVIFEQRYDELTSDAHIEWMLRSFDDPRYFRVGGRPLLAIYYPQQIPEHRRVLDRWRQVASRAGHDPLVLGGAPTPVGLGDPQAEGLDAWTQGTSYVLGGMTPRRRALRAASRPDTLARWLRHRDTLFDYEELSGRFEQTLADFPAPTVPMVISSWNNTGRRSRQATYTRSTPEAFGEALRRACDLAPTLGGTGPEARRLVSINAWNEWGEGMTLEPSLEHGRGMLDACRSALGA